jgi:hypothetical protein
VTDPRISAVLEGRERWAVVCGDAIETLRQMPDCCVDSVVTDAPYELGFMGKRWDASGIAYNVGLWREVLRVLKPGGHLLAFGGTRTSHRMVCAIEDAGFDVRDSIHWLYGSGFPKALSVSKAIDAEAGAEREVVGSKRLGGNACIPCKDKGGTYGVGVGTTPAQDVPITAPATDEAKQWDGWATALKPSHEPICLARKALDGTVAHNVCTHGCGALNIDACRIATDWNEPDRPESWKRSGHSAKPEADKIAAPPGDGIDCHPAGRWPPNAVFCHSAGCERVGTGVAHTCSKRDRPAGAFKIDDVTYGGGGSIGARQSPGYGDVDGREPVPIYRCAPGCPVAELGRQSGKTVSRNGGQSGTNPNPMSWTDYNPQRPRLSPNDSGTAARFFPCFEYEDADFWPFQYVAKASRSEREKGCEGLPVHTAGDATGGRQEGSDGLNSPRAGAGRTGGQDGDGVRNHHPTVKPIQLCRWLCRLVTPPGGIVLDLFAGSGSILIAAAIEGFRCIGIDREPDYCEIARARLKYHVGGDYRPRKAGQPVQQDGPKQGELF